MRRMRELLQFLGSPHFWVGLTICAVAIGSFAVFMKQRFHFGAPRFADTPALKPSAAHATKSESEVLPNKHIVEEVDEAEDAPAAKRKIASVSDESEEQDEV